MTGDNKILSSLKNLENYVKNNNYSGFDPYDALNSPFLNKLNNRILKLIFTQIFVYSPINLRKVLRIMPEENPKAIGIFLQAYCRLFHQNFVDKEEFTNVSTELVGFLMQNRSTGYSGNCWGFNFNWQDLDRFAKKGLPTIVVTSHVAHAFLDLYEITNNKKYLEIARSSCEFILKDLYITKTDNGICFSYTPIDNYIIHNANALGASLLARVYSITKEDILIEHSKKAFDFLLSFQKNDGSWSYGIDLQTNKERNQIDFHQGFILDSLHDFIKYIKPSEEKYKNALKKGSEFYIQQQFDDLGRSNWRLPIRWPIDIHNQAQGIITCYKLYDIIKDMNYITTAEKIARWTIENMQDKNGFFYYQKWPFFINKISYMRWGQAWMMLALATYLGSSNIYLKQAQTND